MKTVLITGGGHAEIPLIDALHSLGYRVISTGLNTDGLGHRRADLYIPTDFSDPEAVLTIAKDHHVCGIISGCNDFAYLSTAYACACLGFGGHDSPTVAETVHHKDAFRALLRNEDLPFPGFVRCTRVEEVGAAERKLSLPVVVKPTDLTGGKGVAVCRTWEQARQQYFAAKEVSRNPTVLIEEYIEGANHGVSSLLRGGKVCFAFFDNEEYYLNPYLVSGAYSPSDLGEEVKAEIIRQIETIAKAVHLCDGLFHCQCIVRADGMPFLIDPCRRAPGDLYIRLVSFATGIDYPMAIVKSELGLDIEAELGFIPHPRNIARECMMTDRNGVIEGFCMDAEYGIREIDRLQWGQAGDTIEDYRKYKAGIVFFEFQDEAEMQEKMKHLYEHMRILVRQEGATEDGG